MILNNLLFIIPARKNSIRLKDKNIRKIGGKTLVQWSIDFALSSKISLFNIIVSTDSEKIINISKRNCVLFIKRNRKLSGKNAKSEDVILSTLNWYEKNYKERFSKIKAIALLQPTSPFRSYKLFIKAYQFFLKKKADNIFSATSTYIQKKTLNNFLKKNIKPNGNFYITRLKFFLRNKSLFLGNSYGYIIKNKSLLVDIDTLKDYQKAKFLLRKFRASIKSNSILS
jgi:CMP-N-acetylneuraminic acid synthetase